MFTDQRLIFKPRFVIICKLLVFLIWLIALSCYSKDIPDNSLGNRFLLQSVLYLCLVIRTIKSPAKALTHRHFCCHLLFFWCCLAFTTFDAKSAEITFCSLMGPPLSKCLLRTKFVTFFWIRCANNNIIYISAWRKLSSVFTIVFPQIICNELAAVNDVIHLQWITNWLVSNILYWCWAVSQGSLMKFSSCFIYLIRNFLLKKS